MFFRLRVEQAFVVPDGLIPTVGQILVVSVRRARGPSNYTDGRGITVTGVRLERLIGKGETTILKQVGVTRA